MTTTTPETELITAPLHQLKEGYYEGIINGVTRKIRVVVDTSEKVIYASRRQGNNVLFYPLDTVITDGKKMVV